MKSHLEMLASNGAPGHQCDPVGGQLYDFCVQAMEQAVRLTPDKRIEIAEEVLTKAKMLSDTVAEAEFF